MNQNLQTFKYVLFDCIASSIAWSIFYLFSYRYSTNKFFDLSFLSSEAQFLIGLIVVPIFWVFAYFIQGTYRRVYKKARLAELFQTFQISLIGVLILYFSFMLMTNKLGEIYYLSVIIWFIPHFVLTYLPRLIITSITAYRIHYRLMGFKTIIVGNNGSALRIYKELNNQKKSSGNIIYGFVKVYEDKESEIENQLSCLGSINQLRDIAIDANVEEVIIALERKEREYVEKILSELDDLNLVIKIIPDMQDFLLGNVKLKSVFHTPLIQISPELMPLWQQIVKRIFDVVISILSIIIFLPLILVISIVIKFGSKGPIIYTQKRIGKSGREFNMYKFRSMVYNAEEDGPSLSSENDSRITPFGRFLRKVRFDEIPQFYSVIKGDMSIVGPRPERKFYIDQIVERAPHYRILHKVKPGITSWGQVEYGYASTVDEMVERLKYDLLYIENMSLMMDFKILIHTLLIVFRGRGK